jgi:VanZ family protein
MTQRVSLSTWAPVAAWAALIFLLSAQPDPESLSPVTFAWDDAVAHLLLYTVLGALLWRAFARRPAAPPWRRPAGCATISGSLYGVFDEFHQSLVPRRTPDLADVLIDVVGVAIGVALAAALTRRRARRPA